MKMQKEDQEDGKIESEGNINVEQRLKLSTCNRYSKI